MRLSKTLVGAMQEESLFRWAELAYELQRYSEAQTAYRQLVQTYPQSQRLPASLYGLGWSALKRRECGAATAPWEQFLQLRPAPTTVEPAQVREVHYHLGICYIELGDHQNARQHFRQVATSGEDTPPQREAVIKLAALAYQANDFDEAILFYRQALRQADADRAPHFQFLLGESYWAKGEGAQAVPGAVPTRRIAFYPKALDLWAGSRSSSATSAISMLRRLWDEFPNFRSARPWPLASQRKQSNQCEEALPFYAS